MVNFHQKPHTFVESISLKVTNIHESVSFYQEIIGFQVLKQVDKKVILTADGTTPMITLEQPDKVVARKRRTTGLFHFALLLPSRNDLARFVYHLFKKNFQFGASDHLVSEAIYLNDLDGNGIEVYCDRPESDWKWSEDQVMMTTEPLNLNNLLEISDGGWNSLPPKTILGHLHLQVANLQEAKEFYANGLGFQVVSHMPGALFLSTGRYHHHIAVNTWNSTGAEAPLENSVGLKSYLVCYPSEQARNEAVERLEHIGVTVKRENGEYITIDSTGVEVFLLA